MSSTHRRGPRPGPWILAQGRPEREESRDDDFLGENVEIGKIVGFFQAFVSEPEDVEAGFVAVDVSQLIFKRNISLNYLKPNARHYYQH